MPSWFSSQAPSFASEEEKAAMFRDYLSNVDEIRFHGIRTGSGPGETMVLTEWPDNAYMPPALRLESHRAYYEELLGPHGAHCTFDWGFTGTDPLALSDALITRTYDIAHLDTGWSMADAGWMRMNMRSLVCDRLVSRLPRHEWTLAQSLILEFLQLHIQEKAKNE